MEETLISFETAKLAKKKGFNIGSRKGYTFEGNLENPHYGHFYKNLDNSNSLSYEAPTQLLVQK